MRRNYFQFAIMLAMLSALHGSLSAQETTGTIFGTVTDNTGGVIPGATVTATNQDTNVSRSTETGTDGTFSLQFLSPGTYRLEINMTGFKRFDQKGIVLEVNRKAQVNAILQVGSVGETIEVTSDAAIVETSVPAVGSTVTNRDIENLPLVNRDVYTLLTLTAGIDTTSQASDNFGAPMQVTIVNGSPNSGIGSVNYSMDGGSNMNGLRNTGNVAPNPDAVREFRVITNSYSAEYGRFAGAVVDLVTKSGTNQIHGSLFEFVRNDKLNANRWVPGQSSLQKEPLHRNQFGGSAGGPIFRDRTFIFGSYSGLRERTAIFANTATPLTAQERSGDLSASGGTAPKDPLTGQAFSGRIIPSTRIDPVAKRILDTYIPLPNLTGGRYEVQISHPKDTDDLVVKLDHTLGEKHQLNGSVFYATGEDAVGLLGNLPWVTRHFVWHQYNYNAGDTWIISSAKINKFSATYVRNFGGRVNTPEVSLGDLGSKYNIQGAPSLPQIQVSGRFNLNSAIPGPVAGSNLYQMRDIYSWQTSRHSIRVGGEIMLEKMIHDTLLNNYGTFSFNANNPRGSGNATADFLLGLPSTMNQDAPTTKIDNGWYYALFLQDDFRLHSRLTLNLGVRYDLQPPITDRLNRLLTFVPGAQSRIVTPAPAGLLFPGDDGVGRGIIPADKNNFSPRLGFAWDPLGDRKTAIRGAFGIFYGSISGNQWNSSSDNQPFAIRQQFNDVYSLLDPYRLQPGGVSPFPYSYSPSAPRFVPPSAVAGISLDYRSPYSYQMNFAVQRQITSDLSFTVGYVSTLVHRIPISQDLNYPILTANATTANVNTRRPYLSGTLSTINMMKSILNSAYHGLQIEGEKRFARNFSAKGFYSFAKGLDTINTQNSTTQTPQDFNNIRGDRGRPNNDRRHNAVLSGIWRIDYFKNVPRPVRTVIEGWSMAAIVSMRSGTPLTITSGNDRNLDGNGGDRANLVGDPVLDHNRPRSDVVDRWFNTAAFAQPADRTNGNAGRNIIDAPGLKNVDLSIRREFRITEGMRLEFRFESTNAFNIVNLSAPSTGQNSSSTFGKITTAAPMRQSQLGLRLTW